VAHMGFVTLGAFLAFDIQAATGTLSGAVNGLDGAMVQMISHGLISGALFLCIGVMYDRLHSREIGAYGGVINVMPKFGAFMQTDMKKLIAYSSVAHMGFVTLGAFLAFEIQATTGTLSGAVNGLDGAMVQMISHGLISGALFLCIGVMYDRLHSREIGAYGGVINVMPKFGAFMVLFALANSGLPGTSGFVGEFLVILAAYKANFWYAFLAATTLVLGAAYTLWLVKRVIFGPVANDQVAAMKDLNGREFLVLAVLALAVLLLGLWPAPLVHTMEASVQHLLQQLSVSKIPAG